MTPDDELPISALAPRQKKQTDEDINRLFTAPDINIGKQQPLQTLLVHIPVASGDGYFRLRVTTSNPNKTIAASPVFRVGSLSWSSSHPQGATVAGIVPELLVRTAFVTAKTTGEENPGRFGCVAELIRYPCQHTHRFMPLFPS